MSTPESRLPSALLQRASFRGNEYAWSIDDIPAVIKAAQDVGLVSLGGQLQFRLPDGSTCECYWVEVDTERDVPPTLAWNDRVAQSAIVASTEFASLKTKYDFLAEGRRDFANHLDALPDPVSTMCFVWYLVAPDTAATDDH